MRRKESSREKMGCFRGRIPNRLSCNGAPVITNCSIMRMPGKMVVTMVTIITSRGRGRRRRQIEHHVHCGQAHQAPHFPSQTRVCWAYSEERTV